MLLSRNHILVFLLLATVIWAVTLLVIGEDLTLRHFKPFGTTVSILGLLGAMYDKWAWAWPVVNQLSKRPDIKGTWEVELLSNWINPETNEPVPAIKCYAAITQTSSKLQLNLITKESQSWLKANEFVAIPGTEIFELLGIYTNEPKIELRETRSPIHNGAFRLKLQGAHLKPDTLEGEYWTDRSTGGAMSLSNRTKAIHTSFKTAEREFLQTPDNS